MAHDFAGVAVDEIARLLRLATIETVHPPRAAPHHPRQDPPRTCICRRGALRAHNSMPGLRPSKHGASDQGLSRVRDHDSYTRDARSYRIGLPTYCSQRSENSVVKTLTLGLSSDESATRRSEQRRIGQIVVKDLSRIVPRTTGEAGPQRGCGIDSGRMRWASESGCGSSSAWRSWPRWPPRPPCSRMLPSSRRPPSTARCSTRRRRT